MAKDDKHIALVDKATNKAIDEFAINTDKEDQDGEE